MVWANYMFQTNQGPSYPAHQFLFGATSATSAANDHAGIFMAENGGKVGCPITTPNILLVGPDGKENLGMVAPCAEHQTMADELDAAHVSWRYYGSDAGNWKVSTKDGIWIAPNSIAHICGTIVNGQCTGPEWTANVIFSPSQVLTDISTNCNLAGFSWVTPDSYASDHPWQVANTQGPAWVASIVNAVGQSRCKNPDGSSYWNTTAILITWDDWGGWYDHVPPNQIEPPPQGGYQMGFRVPLIVVSAYTPPGLIVNERENFGGLIRFARKTSSAPFKKGALTFADKRAATDLAPFFRLNSPPHAFTPIKAPLNAGFFLKQKPSHQPVDDD